jgi:cytochrome c556
LTFVSNAKILPLQKGDDVRSIFLFSLLVILILSGCNAQPAKPAQPESDYKPTFPIEEVMGHIVMPNADKLWGSVATTVSAKGIEDIVPKTDEDWETVRNYAVTIAEATNLLLIPGRRVAAPGKKEADKSELSPEQIDAKIKGDWSMWASHVAKLHDVAMESITAIDKKNSDDLLEAGDHLDKACEDCHLVYWYPNEKQP